MPSTGIRGSSKSTSAPCARRSIGRSGGPRWRRSAGSATGSGMTRWDSLPIRGRLTIAFAASMAVVIGALSVFVYLRAGRDLLDTIDAGLRSRAEVLASGLRDRGPALPDGGPVLIESDEVFAQIASASGRVLQSSPIISGQRLLPPAAVRAAG